MTDNEAAESVHSNAFMSGHDMAGHNTLVEQDHIRLCQYLLALEEQDATRAGADVTLQTVFMLADMTPPAWFCCLVGRRAWHICTA